MPEPSPTEFSHCPKCGQQLPKQIYRGACPFCGIVLSKAKRKTKPRPVPPIPDPKTLSPSGSQTQNKGKRNHHQRNLSDLVSHWVTRHKHAVTDWARERSPLLSAFVLLISLYLAFRYTLNPNYRTLFDGINLVIHEAGHLLFRFFGTFIMIAGGTLLQLLVPLGCLIAFARKSDYTGVAFCLCWLSTNGYHIAIYVADARAQALPLVTVGGGIPIHDWHFLLSKLGLLSADVTLAFLARSVSFIVIWLAVAYSAWLVYLTRTATPGRNSEQGSVHFPDHESHHHKPESF